MAMVYNLEVMITLIIYNVKLIYRYSVRKHAVDDRTRAGEKMPIFVENAQRRAV
jgi:hypothetical protein